MYNCLDSAAAINDTVTLTILQLCDDAQCGGADDIEDMLSSLCDRLSAHNIYMPAQDKLDEVGCLNVPIARDGHVVAVAAVRWTDRGNRPASRDISVASIVSPLLAI